MIDIDSITAAIVRAAHEVFPPPVLGGKSTQWSVIALAPHERGGSWTIELRASQLVSAKLVVRSPSFVAGVFDLAGRLFVEAARSTVDGPALRELAQLVNSSTVDDAHAIAAQLIDAEAQVQQNAAALISDRARARAGLSLAAALRDVAASVRDQAVMP